ncbi:MAG: acyltransferase [Polaromonas sp.]|nr:acyltransferase [Polaromonas sp.]
MEKNKKEFYIPSLDGLRAIAVSIVFISHAGWGHVIPGGFGVTVFFFLSGYLISTLLKMEYKKNGEIRFKDFSK